MREKCENEATSLSLIFLLLFSVTLSSWEPSWKKKCEWEREERSPSEDFESSRGELERKIATNNSTTTLTPKQQGANKFWAWSLRRHEKRFYLSHNKLCISLSRVNGKVFFFSALFSGGEKKVRIIRPRKFIRFSTSNKQFFALLDSLVSHFSYSQTWVILLKHRISYMEKLRALPPSSISISWTNLQQINFYEVMSGCETFFFCCCSCKGW